MSVLYYAVNVLPIAAWHCSALTHANIDDEAALFVLEELQNIWLLSEHGFWHWGDPDGTVDELLREKVHALEVINIDRASEVGLIKALVEGDFVVFAQEVVLDPKVFELLRAALHRENHLVKQI